MLGRVVGKYLIVEQIGEGGMGSVFRAEHIVLGSPAAVKVLLPQWTQDAVVVDRFFHEARAASAVRHVGIVEVFDYGRLEDEGAWIAMELIRGETLTQLLARNGGPLDPALVQQLGAQLLGALDAAHVVGVVHRDLKPDNILLVPDPGLPFGMRLKILDFGIAKLGRDQFGEKRKTLGGTVLGTPVYMAPEQCRGDSNVDARADLYAVGCILFELLCGRPPFNAGASVETMRMHIYEEAPRLAQLAPRVPPALDALVGRLLAKEPDERVPSAAYALATLERVPLMPQAARVVLLDAAAVPGDRFPRWLVAVLLAAVVIAVVAVIVIGGSGDVSGLKG